MAVSQMGRSLPKVTRLVVAALVMLTVAVGGVMAVDALGGLVIRSLDARDVPGGFCGPDVRPYGQVSPAEGDLAYAHFIRSEKRLWVECVVFLGVFRLAFASGRRVYRARR